MSGFRAVVLPRNQNVLFPERLEDAVPQDHVVRAYDAILSSDHFTAAFEKMSEAYSLSEGKPPYHPKYLAALWLYGMANRIRSSRLLEAAAHNRIDVRWLMHCQTPDHSTICAFVKKHRPHLKELLRVTLRVALGSDLTTIQHVAIDGSKVEANASVPSMKRREPLEQEEKKLESLIQHIVEEWRQNEIRDAGQPHIPPAKNRKSEKKALLAGERQLKKVQRALEALKRREKAHEASGSRGGPPAPVASTTDADARLMRDKEDRSKPNYTTQLGVDAASGLIVAEDVTDDPWDGGGLLPMILQSEENTGVKPKSVSADSAYNTGAALAQMASDGIVAYMPDSGQSGLSSPARNEAIEAAKAGLEMTDEQKALIKNSRLGGRISNEAFRYEADRDVVVCPNGSILVRVRTSPNVGTVTTTMRTQYRSNAADCARCPMRTMCLRPDATTRQISRDEHEPHRQALRHRMATEAGREEYKKRTVTERTHGWLKTMGGLRKFMRRGFAQVRAEYTLACTALNMRILAARFAELKLHPSPS